MAPLPIPFPHPLHIGTDICRVSRIARILRGRQCARFIRRVLAPEELARARPVILRMLEEVGVEAGRDVHKRRLGTGIIAISAATEGSRKGAEEGDGSRGVVRAGRDRGRDGGDVKSGQEGRVLEQGKETGVGGMESAHVQDGAQGEETTTGEEQTLYARAATYLAGRFAAKEAAFKAHPHLRLGFHDILILTAADARETVGHDVVKGWSHAPPVALIKTGEGRDQMARVSISHDGEYATAVCMGFEAGHEGDGGRGQRGGWFPWLSRLWS